MGYTLGTAAKATGLAKITILRGIRKGLFSAKRSETSIAWDVDPSELHRVYPLISQKVRVPESVIVQGNEENPVVPVLRAQLEDLRADRDRWLEEARHWREMVQRLALSYQGSSSVTRSAP